PKTPGDRARTARASSRGRRGGRGGRSHPGRHGRCRDRAVARAAGRQEGDGGGGLAARTAGPAHPFRGEWRRGTSRSAAGAAAPGNVQPARRVAYEVIAAVRETDAYANLLLPVKLERAGLHGGDAALATELTYGTLRQRGYYDAVIEHAAGRSV